MKILSFIGVVDGENNLLFNMMIFLGIIGSVFYDLTNSFVGSTLIDSKQVFVMFFMWMLLLLFLSFMVYFYAIVMCKNLAIVLMALFTPIGLMILLWGKILNVLPSKSKLLFIFTIILVVVIDNWIALVLGYYNLQIDGYMVVIDNVRPEHLLKDIFMGICKISEYGMYIMYQAPLVEFQEGQIYLARILRFFQNLFGRNYSAVVFAMLVSYVFLYILFGGEKRQVKNRRYRFLMKHSKR